MSLKNNISLIVLVSCFLTVSSVVSASAQSKAFELYPATNDATPTTYTKTAPPFQTEGKPWRFAYGSAVQIKINAAQVIRPVTPYQFGNNIAVWEGKKWVIDPNFVELAKEAGIKFWRWPGGSTADSYHWDGNYDRYPKDGHTPGYQNAPWAITSDEFVDFCRQTGSEAIVTVNYGAARYADVQYAADLAARWVKYFNIDKKFKVRYWEIGNESYGKWEEGSSVPGKAPLNGIDYGNDLKVIADAMRKVDPDIYIGAVAYEGESKNVKDHYWTKNVLDQLQGKADYLILHQYFMDSPGSGDNINPTNDTLFGNMHELADGKAALDAVIDSEAPGEKGIPVALTEFNLHNPALPESVQLVNGLFTAEVLGEGIKDGYATSDYWVWKQGFSEKTMGDPAMLASDDASVADGTPRPSYYAYALSGTK